ncbi:MAG: MASE1 domain-containing protein [Planctomycetes bacterium]|nr:MASE1 domain-containing protein [Planctomycetota bacterium]
MDPPRDLDGDGAGRVPSALGLFVVAAAVFASASVREAPGGWLHGAVLWLPSGVAVVATWWWGAPALLAVAAGSAAFRASLEYPFAIVAAGTIGSVAEAALGASLLRRFGVRIGFARIRDVLGLFAAAAAAPVVSLAASWIARVAFDEVRDFPFYSGWDGWWRMNALGILAVVPCVGTWCALPRPVFTTRKIGEAAAIAAALMAVWLVGSLWCEAGIMAVLLQHSVILLALVAALRFGPRGAITTASVTAIAFAVGTARGFGPFLGVVFEHRDSALQLFEVSLLALPLALGALIAERETAFAARIRSERDLHALQELMLDTAYRLRSDGTCIDVIAPKEAVDTGRREQVVGANLRAIVPSAVAETAMANIRATLRGEATAPHEYEVEVDGRTRTREARLTRLSADEVLCVVRDTTEQRQLEEQLRRAQKMEAIGRLAGGVAHDFNNILTVVVGCSEALLATLPAGDPARSDVRLIAEAAERAARLTRQMLALSRRQRLSPEVLELSAVVDGLAGLMRRAVGENVRIDFDAGAEPTTVHVDRGQIEQVVLNLVLNARDALPRGGRVLVSTRAVDLAAADFVGKGDRRAGRYVRLAVTDDGVGMDAMAKSRAFEPFFTTKGAGQGTGLGLATVWGIAEQSGGFADIESSPGAGTTVTVHLPAADASPVPVPISMPATATRVAAAVLVVEDDPNVRDLVARTLRAAGHEVTVAGDGETAVAVAARTPFDALVTDVVMPHCGGRELAERLRRSRPGLRVLFVSGYADGALDGPLPARSAFLAKPFTRQALLASVNSMLRAGAG